MTRNRVKLGIFALVVTALIGGAVVKHRSAHAQGWHHGKAAIMKRIVNAHIDEVLDDAKVTDAQRQTIYAARDRVYTAFENQRSNHKNHMNEALRLFESDRVDPAQLSALRAQRETEMKQISDVVVQALIEAHDVLSPSQRHIVAEHIRNFQSSHAD